MVADLLRRQTMRDSVPLQDLRVNGSAVQGAIAVYTDPIEHDVVGWPGSPLHGKDGARGFYEHLTANFRTEDEQPTHRYEFRDDLISRKNAWLDVG